MLNLSLSGHDPMRKMAGSYDPLRLVLCRAGHS
jgi:hypothetical protein